MCEICWKLTVFAVIIYCFSIFIADFKQVNTGREIYQVFCLQHIKSTSMVTHGYDIEKLLFFLCKSCQS